MKLETKEKIFKIVIGYLCFLFVMLFITTAITDEEDSNTVQESHEITEVGKSETVIVEEPKTETEEEYKTSCQEYKYKDVLRNPSDYIGKRIKVKVQIFNVHEKSFLNETKYYFAYDEDEYGVFWNNMYGIFDKREKQEPKLLEDDVIIVYGEIIETEYTKSLIVNGTEVFCIDMKYIDFISE